MKKERCNCDASCGENRYHDKGESGCMYHKPAHAHPRKKKKSVIKDPEYVLVASKGVMKLMDMNNNEYTDFEYKGMIATTDDSGLKDISVLANNGLQIKLKAVVFK